MRWEAARPPPRRRPSTASPPRPTQPMPQAALARPDLWQELALLEKLLYKNANQHRGARHFQGLQEVRAPLAAPQRLLHRLAWPSSKPPPLPLQVRRLLRLLQALQLGRRAAELHGALDGAKQRGSLPSGSLLAYGCVPLCLPGGCRNYRTQHARRGAPRPGLTPPSRPCLATACPAAGATSGGCPATRRRRACCARCWAPAT